MKKDIEMDDQEQEDSGEAGVESGFNIGTPVEIHPEEMAIIASELCGNIMKTLARWYVGVDYEKPCKNPEKTLFQRMMERQIKRAAIHRVRVQSGKLGGQAKQANELRLDECDSSKQASKQPSKRLAKNVQYIVLKPKTLEPKILKHLKPQNREKDTFLGLQETEGFEVTFDEAFEAFWRSYPSACPRKTEKKKCGRKFVTLLRKSGDAGELLAAILKGLERWKTSELWNADDGRYIKAPLAWLNGELWEDEPKQIASAEVPMSTVTDADRERMKWVNEQVRI